MVETVRLGHKTIGGPNSCFVIAEAGVNHNGKLDIALQLVDTAKSAGADAIKFQLFRLEEQISEGAPTALYQQTHTGSKTMQEMAKSYDLPWESHRVIRDYCIQKQIQYSASCFDMKAVAFLDDLGGTFQKVGSGEITNFPLLRCMAHSGKPILLSTGMSTLADVEQAVKVIQNTGNSSIVLLQCTSSYPTAYEAVNLKAMVTMADYFQLPVGFSDHTVGSTAAIAAIALKACVIEKHFTIDKSLPGPDHAMSASPQELKAYISDIRNTEILLGNGIKEPHSNELPIQSVARRSIVSVRTIEKGEILSESNLTLKRPATGIDPRQIDSLRGRHAAVVIPEDTPLTWDMIS